MMQSNEEFRVEKNRRLREWHHANPGKAKEYKTRYTAKHPSTKRAEKVALPLPGESQADYLNRKQKEYYAANRVMRLLYTAKHRAKRDGLKFALVHADIQIPDVCPVFGVPFEFGKGRVGPMSPTLDKITPKNGYVPGNIQVISHLANSMKNNATKEQLISFAEWVLRKFGENNG
jgi:hypothetical protein